jgi:hypothetical protein
LIKKVSSIPAFFICGQMEKGGFLDFLHDNKRRLHSEWPGHSRSSKEMPLKKILFLTVVSFWMGSCAACAQNLSDTTSDKPATQIAKPMFLRVYDKIKDSSNPNKPAIPETDFEDKPLQATATDEVPDTEIMNSLTDPVIVSQIKRLNKLKEKTGKVTWGKAGAWNVCHSKDKKGNHWYGWKTGGKFHWTIFKNGRFWWRDANAGRWLFFYKGYWWWPNGKDPRKIQVLMGGGHYYLCDSKGVIGKDMSPTGK